MSEHYRIGARLGRGGISEVHEASLVRAGGFEKRVAFKRLLPDAARDPEIRARFFDEARLMSRLDDPSVVAILDFGEMDGVAFQVLERVDGLDLAELTTRAADRGAMLPSGLALFVASEVARALGHVHEAAEPSGQHLGIVHRDVKPGNVLVSWSGAVKLADFGIAAVGASGRTRVGRAVGTPQYMAPEQARGEPTSPRSDLFSLGCLLHYLLTGASPLDDEAARLASSAGEEVELSKAIPDQVRSILRRALSPDPSGRFHSAHEMRRALWTEAARLAEEDPRSGLAAWLSRLRPSSREDSFEALFDLMLVDEPEEIDVRQFTAVASGAFAAALTEPGEEEATLGFDGEGTDADTQSAREDTPAGPLAGARSPDVGSVLDGYRLLERIDAGTQGTIFRARHETLGTEVAVKVGVAADRSSPITRRLLREARAVCELSHPNVVSGKHAGIAEDGSPFICMELFEGENLAEILETRGALPREWVIDVAESLAAGLSHAHSRGLVHRDLKPANAMAVSDGGEIVIKILDFGLARNLDADETRLTAADSLLGTPAYMAPEQIVRPMEAGAPADVYALGCTIYALLHGRPPFVGRAVDVISKHLEAPAPRLEEGGPFDDLVAELLDKDPARRPTAEDARARLSALRPAPDGSRPGVPGALSLRAPTIPSRSTGSGSVNGMRSPVESSEARPSDARGLLVVFAVLIVALSGITIALLLRPSESPVMVADLPFEPDGGPSTVLGAVAAPLPSPRSVHADAALEIPLRPDAGVRERKRSRARPRPHRARPDRSRHRRRFAEALSAQGLMRADVSLDPGLAALVRSWKAVLSDPDDDRVEAATSRLEAHLGSFEIGDSILRSKLARVSERLASAPGRLPVDRVRALERRYFDLRTMLRPGLQAQLRRRLAMKISALERDLAE